MSSSSVASCVLVGAAAPADPGMPSFKNGENPPNQLWVPRVTAARARRRATYPGIQLSRVLGHKAFFKTKCSQVSRYPGPRLVLGPWAWPAGGPGNMCQVGGAARSTPGQNNFELILLKWTKCKCSRQSLVATVLDFHFNSTD